MAKENIEIIYRRTDDLIPYENNPRSNAQAVGPVAESIKEFGFKQPIVIDKNNVIAAGHTRLKAAKELGMEWVPVIIADDLTHDQIKAYRLADNKTGEFAEWDFGALQEELEDVDMDMGLFGFTIPDDETEEFSNSQYGFDDFEDSMVLRIELSFEDYQQVNSALLSIDEDLGEAIKKVLKIG